MVILSRWRNGLLSLKSRDYAGCRYSEESEPSVIAAIPNRLANTESLDPARSARVAEGQDNGEPTEAQDSKYVTETRAD